MHIAATPPLNSSPNNRISVSVEQHHADTEKESSQQLQVIKQLKARDSEVRAHEQAHLSVGHGITHGGASFSYQRGPDGVQYAVGGEVQIDTSKVVGDPEATLEKARKIQAAALAPLQPSSQDRNIAAQAAQMAIEARAEIAQQTEQKPFEKNTNETSNTNPFGELIDFKI